MNDSDNRLRRQDDVLLGIWAASGTTLRAAVLYRSLTLTIRHREVQRGFFGEV